MPSTLTSVIETTGIDIGIKWLEVRRATPWIEANQSVPCRSRYAARISPLGTPSELVNRRIELELMGPAGSTRSTPRPVHANMYPSESSTRLQIWLLDSPDWIVYVSN